MNKIANNETRTTLVLALISVLFLSFIFASPAFAAENIEYYDFKPGNEFTVERVDENVDTGSFTSLMEFALPSLCLATIIGFYCMAILCLICTIIVCWSHSLRDSFNLKMLFIGIFASAILFAIATELLINY